jgi:hypothetical protein
MQRKRRISKEETLPPKVAKKLAKKPIHYHLQRRKLGIL